MQCAPNRWTRRLAVFEGTGGVAGPRPSWGRSVP